MCVIGNVFTTCLHPFTLTLLLQYTNFELGVRVPLIVRAPWLKKSAGQVTGVMAELVDLYPTIAELAGIPVTDEAIDGVSLAPVFEDPTLLSIPTSVKQGTMNKVIVLAHMLSPFTSMLDLNV